MSRCGFWTIAALSFAAFVFVSWRPVAAMEIKVEGDTVFMSGPVAGHECQDLRKILDTTWIRKVVLSNSQGGHAGTGYCVGELIRARGVNTGIQGSCASSCSRMWLGGVERTLDGANARVGLHGHYDTAGNLLPDSPARLRAWLPKYSAVDPELMEKWIVLPRNFHMMYFYNHSAELCLGGKLGCDRIPGKTAQIAGLMPEPFVAVEVPAGSRHARRKSEHQPSGFARVEEWTKLPIPTEYLPNYFSYLNARHLKALAISLDRPVGAWSTNRDPSTDLVATALRTCKERAGSDCVLYAIDNEVVYRP